MYLPLCISQQSLMGPHIWQCQAERRRRPGAQALIPVKSMMPKCGGSRAFAALCLPGELARQIAASPAMPWYLSPSITPSGREHQTISAWWCGEWMNDGPSSSGQKMADRGGRQPLGWGTASAYYQGHNKPLPAAGLPLGPAYPAMSGATRGATVAAAAAPAAVMVA